MKEKQKLSIKLLLVLLLVPLFSVQRINATPGRLRGGSIVNIGGVNYGQHGSDDHWHKAQKSGGYWMPLGPMFGSLDEIRNSQTNQPGWQKKGSTWYYNNSNGVAQTGWVKVGSTWYYMNSSGAMQTGWTKVGSTWYYLNSSGAMQTGWTKVGNTWYYMNNSGAMQTGWTKVGNTWYYMSGSGAMQTGWTKVGSTWYYMTSSGAMQTGWTKVGNTWYYMSGSGAMQTGWIKLGTRWYYMNNSGAMQIGQINVGGILYYFNSSGVLEKELGDALTEVPDTVPSPIENMDDAIIINNNIPWFTNDDLTSTEVYHLNGKLDALGRVTVANAVVGVEIMPTKERGSISHHTPTGWSQRRYTNIGAGGWLYNRSHLIGHQMTGNDNFNNLMTGTRWFNMRMTEYENWLANYVEQTENHVRYRITPIFEGNNLVASGIYMEGFSIEDLGEGVMFNVFVPNIQPGVEINYKDGSSVGPEGPITYEQLMASYDNEEEALKDIFSINLFV